MIQYRPQKSFDILNEREVSPGEPVWLDFNDEVKAQFTISRDAQERLSQCPLPEPSSGK